MRMTRGCGPGSPQLTHAYAYDSAYRLINTQVKDAVPATIRSTAYTLDHVQNRTTVAGNGSPNQGTYTMTAAASDDVMNQYTTTSFDAREYVANGNLRKINAGLQPVSIRRSLVYDYANRMVGYRSNAGSIDIEYYYDAFGRRVGSYDNNTAAWITYYYDGDRVIEEQVDDGTGTGNWSTAATYVYGPYIDEIVQMQRSGADYYYHCDDQYNVMAVTTGSSG